MMPSGISDSCRILSSVRDAHRRAFNLPGSGRTTGNPSLTRRWSFGRVTEGLPTTGSNAPPTRNRQFETVREKPCLLWSLVEVLRHSDGSVESTLSDEYSQSIA